MKILYTLLLTVLVCSHSFAKDRTPNDRLEDQKALLVAIEHYQNENSNVAASGVQELKILAQNNYADIPILLIDMLKRELTEKNKSGLITQDLLSILKNTISQMPMSKNDKVDGKLVTLSQLRELYYDAIKQQPKRFGRSGRQIKSDWRAIVDNAGNNGNSTAPKIFPEIDTLTVYSLTKKGPGVIAAEETARRNAEAAAVAAAAEAQLAAELKSKTLRTTTPEDQESARSYPKFKDELLKSSTAFRKGNEVKAGENSPEDLLLAGTLHFVTDEQADRIITDTVFKVINREEEEEKTALILARRSQNNVVWIGSKGSGKSEMANLVAHSMVTGKYLKNRVTEFLGGDAIMVQTSSARISRLAKSDKPAGQADAMEAYFQALSDIQKKLHRRIIVFIDEIHTLTADQAEAIKPFIASSDSQIMLLGASTSEEFQMTFKHNEAFVRRIQCVGIRELSEAEILQVLQTSWAETYSPRHEGMEMSEDVMKLMIRQARIVYPDKGDLDAALMFADDLGGFLRFKRPNESPIKITSADIYSFIKRQIGLPVDPRDSVGMEKYRKQLIADISKNVYGQDRMVEEVVNMWMNVLRNESKRGIRVQLILGRTGTGKTEVAEQLALHALGSKQRVFTLKGSDFADANDIKMGTIFGVPVGVGGNEKAKTSGTLMNFLGDESRGKYAGIILIDEIDKANLFFFYTMMELFDTGIKSGGDGKIRSLNKHLIILTSNHGDHMLYPDQILTWAESEITKRIHNYTTEELRGIYEKIMPDSIVRRIDGVTVSNLIFPRIAREIANREIKTIADSLLDRSEIFLTVDPKVIEAFIVANDPMKGGARSLVRSLAPDIVNAIEKAKGSIGYNAGDAMYVTTENKDGINQLRVNFNGESIFSTMPRFREGDMHTGSSLPENVVPIACMALFSRAH